MKNIKAIKAIMLLIISLYAMCIVGCTKSNRGDNMNDETGVKNDSKNVEVALAVADEVMEYIYNGHGLREELKSLSGIQDLMNELNRLDNQRIYIDEYINELSMIDSEIILEQDSGIHDVIDGNMEKWEEDTSIQEESVTTTKEVALKDSEHIEYDDAGRRYILLNNLMKVNNVYEFNYMGNTWSIDASNFQQTWKDMIEYRYDFEYISYAESEKDETVYAAYLSKKDSSGVLIKVYMSKGKVKDVIWTKV